MNLQLLAAPAFWQLLIGGLAAVVLLWWLLLGAGRRSRRRALQRQIAALRRADSDSTLAALSTMRRGIADAAQVLLRPAGRPPGRAQLYSVPWMLFVGDAAADVPRLLATAHQASATPAPPARASIGDAFWRWWSLGSLTAIETHADAVCDASATRERMLWFEALQQLLERRERQPLDGIVVCVGASTLAGAAPEIDETATQLRRLVDEVSQSLRLRLPVYLVINGLGQLRGHDAITTALAPEVLSQALGYRLPHNEAIGAAGPRLEQVFGVICNRLQALRMSLARRQPQTLERLAAHRFVEDVIALGPGLRRLTERLFDAGPNGDDSSLRWRGLYLVASADGARPGAFVADLFQRFLAVDQPLARPRG